MITVVDYGMGNLRNVRRAFEAIGCDVRVTSESEMIRSAGSLVLPGVGAFGEAMKRIDSLGLRGPVCDHAASGKPLLGICLGMQLLFERSEESPGVPGLGLLSGEVRRFTAGIKLPHIGWNDVTPVGASTLFPEPPTAGVYYFVHSYITAETPFCVARTEYGEQFVAALQRENIMAVQFHPEKSQGAGLRMIRSFAGMD